MVTAGFVAPYLLDTTTRFVEAAARLPGVRLALITCEPEDRLPPQLGPHLAGHWRIDDPLDPGQHRLLPAHGVHDAGFDSRQHSAGGRE